jgi:hypothetical protein
MAKNPFCRHISREAVKYDGLLVFFLFGMIFAGYCLIDCFQFTIEIFYE